VLILIVASRVIDHCLTRVLDVARGIVERSLDLVYFAFRLKLRISNCMPDSFFGFTHGIVDSTFHVFLIHVSPLEYSDAFAQYFETSNQGKICGESPNNRTFSS
jgi:hypothetical protein